jgi:hypothetical protein
VCSDPLLTYLKETGYNAIRLPKADVRPLQVYSRTGKDLERLGELSSLMVTGNNVQTPTIKADVPAAGVAGQRTSDLSFGVGLSILGTILGAMGGSKLGLEAKYQQAKYVAFEFPEVLADSIELVALDQYFGDADVNPFSVHVARMLESDELYVTTATIKATKFAVEAKKSATVGLQIDVPVIQEVVGGNVKVSASAGATSKLTYQGNVPLVFGFQAVRLFYDQGSYKAFKPVGIGDVAMKSLTKVDKKAEWLMTEGVFVRLHESV